MTDERRHILSLIAKNQHTGITAIDLAFAAQNQNLFVQQIIETELSLGHITEIRIPNAHNKYKMLINEDFRDVPLSSIDPIIFKLHQVLQGSKDGLQSAEIATIIKCSLGETQQLLDSQYSKSFIQFASEEKLDKYVSSLTIDVSSLVVCETSATLAPYQKWTYILSGIGGLSSLAYYIVTTLF